MRIELAAFYAFTFDKGNRFSSTEDEETTRRRAKGIPWKDQPHHEHLYSKRRPQLDRDDRLKEIQSDYKSDNFHKKRQLKQLRHDYSQQRQALASVENRARKQQTNLEKPKSFINRVSWLKACFRNSIFPCKFERVL